ncbi:MAG: DegQ family serine endoprotease [Oligoflexia bacterium]|nr:DegQ family serine endoprotease [Oligoflexia bacterium]
MYRRACSKFGLITALTTTLTLWLGTFTLMLGFAQMPAWAEDSEQGIEQAQQLSSAFERVANLVTPSVVNIRAVKHVKQTANMRMRKMPNNPFFDQFRDFFGNDFDQDSPFGAPPEGFGQEGMGTGVIIDDKGHIVTNNHVVGDADELTVKLSDDREVKAKLVGSDPKSDIAVIQIEANNLKGANFGNSDELKIGEWVVAIGNPFGLDNTITAGIVSAKGRSIMPGKGQYEDFIQTDAAINPGNSGGPLLNLRGEVIGINTAIFSRSGGYMGIGFAIPSTMVRTVAKSLIEKGKVVRGWLGIVIQPLTEDLAKSFNFPSTDGILVGQVDPDGPAAKAGIQQGDIIVAFEGGKIRNINQFRNTVAARDPGSSVNLEVVRDGRKKEFSVEIGELPTSLAGREDNDQPSAMKHDIGIQVQSLTAEMAKQLGTKAKNGVIVTDIAPGSPAARAGMQPRDIIKNINGKDLKGAADFEKQLDAADLKKGVRFVIENGGMERFVFLKIDGE